jgi:hypothetical protein
MKFPPGPKTSIIVLRNDNAKLLKNFHFLMFDVVKKARSFTENMTQVNLFCAKWKYSYNIKGRVIFIPTQPTTKSWLKRSEECQTIGTEDLNTTDDDELGIPRIA